MEIEAISDKLLLRLFCLNLPISLELILFGFTSRAWILEYGTHDSKMVDYEGIGTMVTNWVLSRYTGRRSYRWSDFSIEDLAEAIGQPQNCVRDWFQLVMRQDFRSWKILQRIELAKRVLCDFEDMEIGEAARIAGFDDFPNFSRQFRRVEGISASEYKERCLRE